MIIDLTLAHVLTVCRFIIQNLYKGVAKSAGTDSVCVWVSLSDIAGGVRVPEERTLIAGVNVDVFIHNCVLEDARQRCDYVVIMNYIISIFLKLCILSAWVHSRYSGFLPPQSNQRLIGHSKLPFGVNASW